MEVLNHHIYEYKKGLRNLILHTCGQNYKETVLRRLIKEKIDYLITELDNGKINIFFGKPECVEVVKNFTTEKLNLLSDEEDFILGVMLGYDRLLQCRRYIDKKILQKMKTA